MEFSQIEIRREQLKAFLNAIECVKQQLLFELDLISGKLEWAKEEDIERAKIRAEVLHIIIIELENVALK